MRSVQVYDVVNVGTHPQLREVALRGELHRFEGGEVLAIAFVYHDPAARKLALVVPEALRHEELRLRAKLLSELADDPEAIVPAYVRDAASVIGTNGLAAYLERARGTVSEDTVVHNDATLSPRDSQLAQREAALRERDKTFAHLEAALREREAAFALHEIKMREHDETVSQREAGFAQLDHDVSVREQAVTFRESVLAQRAQEIEAQLASLAHREQRLAARAEDITAREDEMRQRIEEVEAAQADIAMREQELESRFESLSQREAGIGPRDKSRPIRVRDSELVQVVDDEMEEEVEEVEELDPIPTSPGDIAEVLAAVEIIEKKPSDSDAPAMAADDDVEELEDIEPIETGVHRDLPGEDTDTRESAKTESPPAKPPSVLPPAELFDAENGASVAALAEPSGVRLFVRLSGAAQDGFVGDEPELLAQLVTIEDYPVVLLSLVGTEEGRLLVLRGALDPKSPDDRSVLEQLRRRFAATVAIFTAGKRYVRSFELSAPREVNVARLMERVARTRTAAKVDQATALGRALAAPPPVWTADHPFGGGDAPAANAREAATELERIGEWASPEKIDQALLVLSVPSDRVDATFRQALGNAVDQGIALDARLVERAVSLGVAPDAPALITRQIEAFRKTSELPDHGGLGPDEVAQNWERLLKTAAENEIALDTGTHDLAWRTIREVRGGDAGEVDLGKLGEAGVPELLLMLEHPRYRRDAALELCRRKDPAIVETVCKSVRKMPRAEVVRVVARLVPFGDDIGDALVDGLTARKTFVRQAFALALGHMKLRRAVVPLLHLMASEESDVWREVARIVGGFGNASLRAVTTQLREPKGREDRFVLCLAHLANNGCAKQIEKLVTDERPSVATMAREALTLRDRARQAEDGVRSAGSRAGNDAILEFSRRFYLELEGKAPEQDLEEPQNEA